MPRLRKATAVHLLQGTEPQHKGTQENVLILFTAGRPKMPRDFSPAEEAEWKRMLKGLWRRRTVCAIDGSALETYCRMFAAWRKAMDDGNYKQAAQLATHVRMYQQQFSATPASRENTRPAAPPKPPPPPVQPPPTDEELFEAQIKANQRDRVVLPTLAPPPAAEESLDDFEVPEGL
jgi:phage terminase small subunit